jgi:hypothetical protein
MRVSVNDGLFFPAMFAVLLVDAAMVGAGVGVGFWISLSIVFCVLAMFLHLLSGS